MAAGDQRYDMYSRGSSGWAISMRNEELQEEDVWAAAVHVVSKERKHFTNTIVSPIREPLPAAAAAAARMIPRPLIFNYNSSTGTTTTATTSSGARDVDDHQQPKSAPVNIPDWSKIYGRKKHINIEYDDEDHGINAGRRRGSIIRSDSEDEDGDDQVDMRMMMIPPHEWIAQKLARSQISSFSVCEGVGRTLKGRDLSRVRNAVLSRTGFLE